MLDRLSKRNKRKLKALHPATKAIAVIALLAGILGGAIFCHVSFQNDRFLLKGETQISLTANGESFTYTEEGVEAVCFGRDASDKLSVSASEGVVKNADGSYTIPTDKEGVYTLTYTVDCYKFGEKSPNGVIKRIRVFTVDALEDDGKGE